MNEVLMPQQSYHLLELSALEVQVHDEALSTETSSEFSTFIELLLAQIVCADVFRLHEPEASKSAAEYFEYCQSTWLHIAWCLESRINTAHAELSLNFSHVVHAAN